MFNIALFGCGRIGKVHAVNIDAHPLTQIKAVIDPYHEGAAKLADEYDAEVMTTEKAMADPDIHAVVICSATDTHANLIEQAARAGKAIFCEKPIDLSLERVRGCLNVVNENNAKLLVGFNRRYDPQFRTLKDLFESGAIGKAETLVITSRDPSPPPAEYVRVSGGIFRDMSIASRETTSPPIPPNLKRTISATANPSTRPLPTPTARSCWLKFTGRPPKPIQ